MRQYPFQPTNVQVSIPKRFRSWFAEHATVEVQLDGGGAAVPGESPYRIIPLTSGGYAVARGRGSNALVVGEFDQYTVRRTLNNRVLRQIGVLRSAVYGVSFPAPVAYVLGDYSLVHPGECFNKHEDSMTRKALYSVKDEEARCCICKEPFV